MLLPPTLMSPPTQLALWSAIRAAGRAARGDHEVAEAGREPLEHRGDRLGQVDASNPRDVRVGPQRPAARPSRCASDRPGAAAQPAPSATRRAGPRRSRVRPAPSAPGSRPCARVGACANRVRRATGSRRRARSRPWHTRGRTGSGATPLRIATERRRRRCPAVPSARCRRAPRPPGGVVTGSPSTNSPPWARRSAISASAIACVPPTGTGQPAVCATVPSISPAPTVHRRRHPRNGMCANAGEQCAGVLAAEQAPRRAALGQHPQAGAHRGRQVRRQRPLVAEEEARARRRRGRPAGRSSRRHDAPSSSSAQVRSRER